MINTDGLLWQIDSKSIIDNIQRAALCFRVKFGFAPTICHCNIEQLPDVDMVGGIEIVGARNRPKGTLWLTYVGNLRKEPQ